jgi:hypothetical protein
LWPGGGHYVVDERPQAVEQRRDRRRASLEAAWCADAEERPHKEAEIEAAGMNEQTFKHILAPTHVRTPEPTRLVEMSAGSLQQFPALPEEPFPAVAADPAAIRIDGVALFQCSGWMRPLSIPRL